jgi:hypothetical protein
MQVDDYLNLLQDSPAGGDRNSEMIKNPKVHFCGVLLRDFNFSNLFLI